MNFNKKAFNEENEKRGEQLEGTANRLFWAEWGYSQAQKAFKDERIKDAERDFFASEAVKYFLTEIPCTNRADKEFCASCSYKSKMSTIWFNNAMEIRIVGCAKELADVWEYLRTQRKQDVKREKLETLVEWLHDDCYPDEFFQHLKENPKGKYTQHTLDSINWNQWHKWGRTDTIETDLYPIFEVWIANEFDKALRSAKKPSFKEADAKTRCPKCGKQIRHLYNSKTDEGDGGECDCTKEAEPKMNTEIIEFEMVEDTKELLLHNPDLKISDELRRVVFALPEGTLMKRCFTIGNGLKITSIEVITPEIIEKMFVDAKEIKDGFELVYRFHKVYPNVPLGERRNTCCVIDNEPLSWQLAKNEIENKTEVGRKALKQLIELKVI